MYLCAVKNKLPINIAKFLTEYTMKQKRFYHLQTVLAVIMSLTSCTDIIDNPVPTPPLAVVRAASKAWI